MRIKHLHCLRVEDIIDRICEHGTKEYIVKLLSERLSLQILIDIAEKNGINIYLELDKQSTKGE